MGLFHRRSGGDHHDEAAHRQPFSWKLPRQASSLAPEDVYTNADLDPTTDPAQRTWGYGTWFSFWVAASLDPAFWQTGASLIPLGLSVGNAIGIVILGNCVIAVPIVLNGMVGANLRIPFPVAARASMGYWLSYFAVISRCFLSLIWFGVETYNGGLAMTQFLRAIWPSYANIPNALPESAGISTRDMTSYFLFWLAQLPFFFLNPNQLRWAFLLKTVVVPVTMLATMGALVHKAGGGGPLFDQPNTVSGKSFSQAWLIGFAALQGNWATLSVNSSDFTRYSKTPRAQWSQALAIPVSALFVTICGILAASASIPVYGLAIEDAYWSPFDIMDQWGSRAATAFAALAWMLAGIAANITANSISSANDLVSICPQYINLTRGQIITALLGGWAVAPWKILASSGTFLTFVSGYAIFLGPFAALITSDYFLVKHKALHVPELYDPRGIYRYTGGVNWRAAATLVLTITPNLPGLINAINPDVPIGNIAWWYAPGFITGYIPAVFVYWGLNVAFPHHATLLAEAVSAEDVDLSVPPTFDDYGTKSNEHKDAYEMGSVSVHA
ncbi:uracil permease [Rhodotorula diobovata]|uniref:Uracil permease n=1 Tax=Rhodotorula diobovata TaxID=5288 RepID=A0A5C5FKZ3_9BASI|nr:uracil permease [Rhodotorula diobovata]